MRICNGILINCKRTLITSYKLEKLLKVIKGFMKLNLQQLKMEKQIHTEDPSLKNESSTKRNEIERLKKLNSHLEVNKKKGIHFSLFFFGEKKFTNN